MAPPRTRQHWNSRQYPHLGFIYSRNGVAYINIADKIIRSTKMKFAPDNKAILLDILDKAIFGYLHPQMVENTTEILTVSELIKEFASLPKNLKNLTLRKRCRTAVKHFVKKDYYINQTKEIRDLIIANYNASRLHPNTIRKVFQVLKRIFNYAVEQFYIDKNPISDHMIPSFKKEELKIFTEEQVFEIIQYFGKKNNVSMNLLVRFMNITGMRISEAIKSEWFDINDKRILIHGKNNKDRPFPIETYPELLIVLDELKKLNIDGKLFKWGNIQTPQKSLKRACIELGIYNKGQNFHSIRKLVENRMLFIEGMNAFKVAELMGHTRIVQEAYYAAGYKESDFIKQFNNERKVRLSAL